MSILDNTKALRELLALAGGAESGGSSSGGSSSGGSGSGGYGGTGSNNLPISAKISADSDCYGEPCYGHYCSIAVTINSGATMYFSAEPYCEYRGEIIRYPDRFVNLDSLSYEDTVVITTYAEYGFSYNAEGCSVEHESDDTSHTFTITNIEDSASITLEY